MKSRTKTQLLAELKAKAISNRIIEIKNTLEILKEDDEINLDGCEVKLKMEDYSFRAQNNELSEDFINWLSENGEVTYIARSLDSMKNFYSLDNVETWIFNKLDLELVE